jgi:hypothetical protein
MAEITISVPVGTLSGDPQRGGEVAAAPGFGINTSGKAYFSPSGATAGQAAWLRMSPEGHLKLVQSTTTSMDYSLVEGDVRPLELPDSVTVEIREKAGNSPAPPAYRMVAVLPCDGRPVDVADLQTVALRHGRPLELPDAVLPPVRVKVGGTVARVPAAVISPQIHEGRPLELPGAVTGPVRSGRPSETNQIGIGS